MNRSLLLVICDFLLLSMLALAKFDEPEEAQQQQVTEAVQHDTLADQDLIDVLRMSLESERDDGWSWPATLSRQRRSWTSVRRL